MKKNGPKYIELVTWIQEKINSKELKPGEKLYSENELSAMFNLSRQTVRHAIGILENDGMLKRVQGSGTYISDGRNPSRDKKRIAVITTYVDSYIFPRMIQEVEKNLFENGYSVQIAFTNNQVEREQGILKDVLEKDEISGIIMEATKSGLPNPNMHLFREIMKRKIPILFINSYYPGLKTPHVSLNDKLVAKKMVQYMIQRGHTKIGGIFKLDDGQGHLRYSGYMEAMNAANLATDDERVVWFDTKDFRHLSASRERILNCVRGCTALLCYNDEVAFAVSELLKKENISIPDQLSIAGIDDSDLAVMGDIQITSIPNPVEEVTKMAVANLIQMVNNFDFNGNYEFDSEVKERNSVKTLNI